MKRILLRVGLWLGLLMVACAAQAHESRPAYLEINELTPNRYTVLWRTPVNSGMALPVRLQLPPGVRDLSPPAIRDLSDSRIESHLIESSDGLAGKRIVFVGLQGTITDVLVRVQLANGSQTNVLVHPSNAWVEIPREEGWQTVARTYVAYGIEHILGGADHLLFVLALLLVVRGWRRMVATVTAFTVAHSLTLAAATLGWVHVPAPPVEATIALSIVFVAAEIVHGMQGRPGPISRAPWLVAFCFGLLHGLGFASALAAIGLPQQAIPLALFCFNVGVEIGQLTFVAVIMAAIALLHRLPLKTPRWAPYLAPYAIGSAATFWVFQRVAAFWS
jgi:hydrogenase/urease accessory protein HupE